MYVVVIAYIFIAVLIVAVIALAIALTSVLDDLAILKQERIQRDTNTNTAPRAVPNVGNPRRDPYTGRYR